MRPPMFHPQNRPHFDHGHGQINKHGPNNGIVAMNSDHRYLLTFFRPRSKRH